MVKDTQFYARFISFGVVDGSSIIIQNNVDAKNNEFLVVLPHFTSNGMIDPGMSASIPIFYFLSFRVIFFPDFAISQTFDANIEAESQSESGSNGHSRNYKIIVSYTAPAPSSPPSCHSSPHLSS